MSQQEQQDQYDLSRLLKKPSAKPSSKKKVLLPTPPRPVQPPSQPKLQLPVSVLQHPQPQLQTSFLAKPLHIQQQERLRKQQQEQKAQKQREQIALLRDFVSGYVDFSAVEPFSKQTILKFVKTFKSDATQQSTKDELVKLIKSERRRLYEINPKRSVVND